MALSLGSYFLFDADIKINLCFGSFVRSWCWVIRKELPKGLVCMYCCSAIARFLPWFLLFVPCSCSLCFLSRPFWSPLCSDTPSGVVILVSGLYLLLAVSVLFGASRSILLSLCSLYMLVDAVSWSILVSKSDWPPYLVARFLDCLYALLPSFRPSVVSLFVWFFFFSSLVFGHRPCRRFATSCFCVSSLCLLCRVLMSWGGVLAGWSCCVCVVYVFSLCFLLRRRKVLPPM